MYICPVCGFDRLTDPPLNFTICPCCGTEFEYDDAFADHAALRTAWLRNGPRWWSPVDQQPQDWDPLLQVNNVLDASPIWPAVVVRNMISQLFTKDKQASASNSPFHQGAQSIRIGSLAGQVATSPSQLMLNNGLAGLFGTVPKQAA